MLASREPVFNFPPEIVDEIIDLVDETSTLLSFGLVCRRALINSRRCLFSTLEFTKNKSFDQFLHLAGAPWTSFTSAVKEIHLRDLFHYHYPYRDEIDPTQVASNLRNVKSLSISLHSIWKIGWRLVPRHVLDVIFQLNIHDLQLDGVGMWKTEDIVMLFSRLPPSVKTLALRKLRFYERPELSCHLSIFRRPFRFRTFDNVSLALFKDVLDPLVNPALDVSVQTFHIRPPVLPAVEASNPVTRRFLHHVGHSVEQLLITFDKPYTLAPLNESISYLEATQLTQCINVRMLYIGFTKFAYTTREIPLLVSAMWKMLSTLPSPNALQEFQFKFRPYKNSLDQPLSLLGFLESPNLLHKVRNMFPNLKMIKIILGVYEPEESDSFLEALRRLNDVRVLEETGIVKLIVIDMNEHVAYRERPQLRIRNGIWLRTRKKSVFTAAYQYYPSLHPFPSTLVLEDEIADPAFIAALLNFTPQLESLWVKHRFWRNSYDVTPVSPPSRAYFVIRLPRLRHLAVSVPGLDWVHHGASDRRFAFKWLA
ncbi:hypothetical protein F5887DRAFT_925146 [Amanita rubescens]|nr:hypothetical protein F5887DRAFT_925146 [Amanita rubescens]